MDTNGHKNSDYDCFKRSIKNIRNIVDLTTCKNLSLCPWWLVPCQWILPSPSERSLVCSRFRAAWKKTISSFKFWQSIVILVFGKSRVKELWAHCSDREMGKKEADLEKPKLYWMFSEWAGLYMKGFHWSYLSTDILMIPRYGEQDQTCCIIPMKKSLRRPKIVSPDFVPSPTTCCLHFAGAVWFSNINRWISLKGKLSALGKY